MSEAKALVIEDYVAKNLPDNVRGDIKATQLVKVTLTDRMVQARFVKLRGVAARRNTSIEEAVARVRSLRDDWD